MKLSCAVLDDYQDVALRTADWSSVADAVDVDVFREHIDGEDALVDAIGKHEIVVIMRERTPFPRSVLARLPRLRLLVTTGPGNASVDMAAAAEQGVVVCGTGGTLEPTAELTWALILGLARSLPAETAALRSGGPWQQTVGTDIAGSTLGVIGLGRLGRQVAKIGQAFGADVVAWSQNLTAEAAAEAGVRLADSLEELLEVSDFVTIHLVLSDRTRGLLGAPELARMRRTAYLVNTSRGPIVDEDALVDALRAGRIAGAGLDVFAVEPLPADHPFRSLPTVLATPHLGYVSRRTYDIFFREAVEDIAAFLAGAPVRRIA
ncbi:D-2-hydroxyacid dehydrogenase family protein [Pseudonocardia xinjiangensis]|uniref:D-2-hydroxyacid dehydrogenase family protein n=1 Tax=Pseudonocardia xinjiangensis TaxID=75289 RepID=A0ABX1RFB2_9PSEU|nr:D-2-hydroxyacid dehydrogenase family protein [Pseudonocardia xinjiangensis]NMH78055.1 D-2-hydroxyacid dehydrogenase family protein [Pseudonocardia xinjiangensis]